MTPRLARLLVLPVVLSACGTGTGPTESFSPQPGGGTTPNVPPFGTPAVIAVSGGLSGTFWGKVALLDSGTPHPSFMLASEGEYPMPNAWFSANFDIGSAKPGSYGVGAATVQSGYSTTWTVAPDAGSLTLTSVTWDGAGFWEVHGSLEATLRDENGTAEPIALRATF
jgi:hypothetical protein